MNAIPGLESFLEQYFVILELSPPIPESGKLLVSGSRLGTCGRSSHPEYE